MTDKAIRVLNELLVDTFNEILKIEQLTLQREKIRDLSITEVHTLVAIGVEKKRTMTEVASELKITTSTLTISVNKLEKKGYVERLRLSDDRRLVHLMLTKRGQIICIGHLEFHKRMVLETIKGLSNFETETLIHSLEQLKGFFKNEFMLSIAK